MDREEDTVDIKRNLMPRMDETWQTGQVDAYVYRCTYHVSEPFHVSLPPPMCLHSDNAANVTARLIIHTLW